MEEALNKRSLPLAVLGCILAVAGLAGYFPPVATEAESAAPARLLMENPGGRIVFTHKAHSTPGGYGGDIACADCHHDLRITPGAASGSDSASGPASGNVTAQPKVMACAACHGTADNPDFIVAHQERYRAEGGEASCASCHHTRMQGLSAKWSHEDHATTYTGDDCESCHHPYRYEFRPGKAMHIKPQKCANCHTAKPNPMTASTLKDATHTRCASCHEDLFAHKARGCSTCHNQVRLADMPAGDVTEADFAACATCHGPIPGAMDAFHAGCMNCHDTAGKGPGKKAPCTQCHRQ